MDEQNRKVAQNKGGKETVSPRQRRGETYFTPSWRLFIPYIVQYFKFAYLIDTRNVYDHKKHI